MSLADALDIASKAEAVLHGKQPLAPIIAELRSAVADAKLALEHFGKALDGIAAVVAEIQPPKTK